MDKDRIQQIADRKARERYDKDFYELPDTIQRGICVSAELEVIDQEVQDA